MDLRRGIHSIMLISVATMLFAFGLSIQAISQGSQNEQIQKDTSAGGSILNPLPSEVISDQQPMIGIKLPQPVPPLNPDSIRLFIDGNDVTSTTQISLEYIFYTPEMPLAFGVHNVLLTFDQVCRKYTDQTSCTGESGCNWNASGSPQCKASSTISPIAWSFRIGAKPSSQPVKTSKPGVTAAPSTTGKYLVKIRSVNLDSAMRLVNCSNCSDSDIKYQEGVDTTGTFDFTSRFYGKTLTGHYDRSVEEITGRPNDRFNFRYIDNNDDINAGDFYLTSRDFSNLTINGVQLRGMMAKRDFGYNSLVTFYGRSQEPQDGRVFRLSYGIKLDSSPSKTNSFRLITIKSKERERLGVLSTSDLLRSIGYTHNYSKKLSLKSEFAFDNHSEYSTVGAISFNKDSGIKTSVNYIPMKPVNIEFGYRNIGPNFNPTVLGTFTEKDREGKYVNFRYANKTNKIAISTFYDRYYNNLHHQMTYDITDETNNSVSSVKLNYGWVLPTVTLNYSKLYGRSNRYDEGIPGTQSNESTSSSMNVIKEFHNTSTFTGTRFTGTLSRYDIDRDTYSTTGYASKYALRSDTTNLNLSTRYKALAQVSYNNSLNKSKSFSTTQSFSRTKTNYLASQFNIIPFKFITNFSVRRSDRKTQTSNAFGGFDLTADLLETQQTATFMYYLSQKKKINLEIINYDKQYRAAANRGRSYDEQSVELGYQMDF